MTIPPTRTILVILGIILIAVMAYAVPSCMEKRRNAATQARVDAGQQGAALDSAKDAIDATARSGARETASEELTRKNAEAIRNADGADQALKPGVNRAGRLAACQRETYRNRPECKGVTQ